MTQPDKPRCETCGYGDLTPLHRHEIQRHGSEVMRCQLPGHEGYTPRSAVLPCHSEHTPKEPS